MVPVKEKPSMSTNLKEQERHIQEMKDQLHKKGGDSMELFIKDSLPLDVKEKILESILSMEEEEQEQPLSDYLKEEGVSLLQPDTLDDAKVHEKLWEVIQAMAGLNQYLYHTDHLSDRQLYEVLLNDILTEPVFINPEDDFTAGYIDILGGCSEEDCLNRLKYYADEDDRELWAEEYSEEDVPEHEDPPYDRDRHLPGPRDFMV
jgi:hypothetical protein